MAHDSRTGCSGGRLAGGSAGRVSASSGRSGLASAGRLAFWARFALVVLLGLLAGLGVAWVSARRLEWRLVAVFALIGFGFGVVVVRRWWPRWLRHYAGIAVLGLGELVARRYGGSLGWEVFLASAMLYGLGLGVWDAVRERRGCGVGCFARSPDGCGPECGMRGRRYVSDAGAVGSEQVSTAPDNRNASVAELAEAEHRLRVSRRRLELLRPLSEESNRITDEILRLYKLSNEEVLREVGLPRKSHTDERRGTEDGQSQMAGQVGEGSASDTRSKRLMARLASGEVLINDERRELLTSWPTSTTAPQPVLNSDENPSELDATAGPNVSGQLDLPLWATPTAWQQATSDNPSVTETAQIQAVLRQGDQDIAANRGHDLDEVLADLDGKPSPAQPAPKPAT